MRILVTGAAGFIGSHLAEALSKSGNEVIGLDCFANNYSRQLKELNAKEAKAAGVKIVEIDLAKDSLEDVVKYTEVIFHLAAQPGISDTVSFNDYVRNNLVATKRLIDGASTSKLKCFVNVSTSSVYGRNATGSEETTPEPTSYYGVTKLAAEQLVMAHHREEEFPACSIRLFSVYGPRERPEKLYPKLIGCILNNHPFPLFEGSLKHSRSFTYVEDAINGLSAILNNLDSCLGEIINLGSDIEITTNYAIELVQKIIGKNAKFKRMPKRPGDQIRTNANIEKARKILNYSPRITPKKGFRRQIEWYKEKIYGKFDL